MFKFPQNFYIEYSRPALKIGNWALGNLRRGKGERERGKKYHE